MVLPTYKMGENFGTGTTKTTNEQPIKMAITCLNASIHQISKRMYTLLNDALNDAMYDITNQEPLPLLDEFEISENKRYIHVTCVNLYSATWLVNEVKKLSPFRGKFLHVTTEGTVPKLRLFYVSFPNFSIDTKCDILRRIKQTTPSINTTFWKIRKTHTFWDKGLAAKLELDAPSIRLLEEMKYEVRVGMGKAYFWDDENDTGHPRAAFLLKRYW